MFKIRNMKALVLAIAVLVAAAFLSEIKPAGFGSAYPPQKYSFTESSPAPGLVPAVSAAESAAPSASLRAETGVLPAEGTIVPLPDGSAASAVPPAGEAFVKNSFALPAGSAVDITGISEDTLTDCFAAFKIPDSVFASMQGKSYKKGCKVKRESLRYVRVLHVGFDAKTYTGELVVNKSIAADILDIFHKLYLAEYPIEKILLVDRYDADDHASMADNNTSAFNYRKMEGGSGLSRHAYGLAIDINPLYNPYVKTRKGKKTIQPKNGVKYADRRLSCPYYIKKGDICCRLFKEHGFSWGGDFKTLKDYQHFQK